MFLTPRRIEKQLERADKIIRILWRLYFPYRKHRELVVEASFYALKVVKVLEQLKKQVEEDFKRDMNKPLEKRSVPPGYNRNEENSEKKEN